MNRKSFLSKIIASLALLGLYGKAVAKGFETEPDVKITDVRRHLKRISDNKGWKEYVIDGWVVDYSIDVKKLTQIYKPK